MNKLILILILFPSILFSQWFEQQVPAGVGILLSIDFANASTGISGGWVFGTLQEPEGRAIYTSSGGNNWILSSLPDSARSLVTIQMINNATTYCAAAYNLFGTRYSYAPNNKFRYSKSEPVVSNLFGRRDTLLGTRGYFLKSTNSGQSWFPYGSLPQDIYYLIGMHFINISTGFVSAQASPFYPWQEKIYKTTSGGLNWSLSYQDPYTEGIRNIRFINNNTGFAVGYVRINNPVYPIEGLIIRTTNGGLNWSQQIFYQVNNFTDITMANSATGFACGVSNSEFKGVIYKTTNSGQSWFKLNFQIDNAILDGIEFYPSSGTGICHGTESVADSMFPGWYLLFRAVISKTTDYGNTWQSYYINDSDNFFIGSKMVTLTNWYVTGGDAFTSAKILHTTNGGQIGIEPISSEVPERFELYQNYPNPFNPTTKIKFSLPSPSKGGVVYVRLVIYDILGKEVASLIPPLRGGQEGLKPGTYEVEWEALNYPSGVYFYRLTVYTSHHSKWSDEWIETKKMVLIK